MNRDISAFTVNLWPHGNPFTDVAIDEDHRAVREVLADQYLVSKT